MGPRSLPKLFKILLNGKSSIRFLIGSIISLSFSIAVVLCASGLMDGFDHSLRSALEFSNGDIKIKKKSGYYLNSKEFQKKLGAKLHTSVLDFQGMLISPKSQGVFVRGISPIAFGKITSQNFSELSDGVYVGSKLVEQMKLKVGDAVTIAFPSSTAKEQGRATIQKFVILGDINHHIHEKDMRMIYINKDTLLKIFNLKAQTTNSTIIKLKDGLDSEIVALDLQKKLGREFIVSPSWKEFEILLEAVQVEKNSISIVLQLIVIISMLNIAAFVIYVFEKKSLEFFMLRSLGLTLKQLNMFWFVLLGTVWIISCLLSLLGVKLCNWALLNLSLFKIPGDIYVLSQLQLVLNLSDYAIVFGISLVWLILIGSLAIYRIKKRSLAVSLKEGFA